MQLLQTKFTPLFKKVWGLIQLLLGENFPNPNNFVFTFSRQKLNWWFKKHSRKNILVWRKKLHFSAREAEVVIPTIVSLPKTVLAEMGIWSHIPCHKFSTSNTYSSVCWNKCKIDFGGDLNLSKIITLAHLLQRSCGLLFSYIHLVKSSYYSVQLTLKSWNSLLDWKEIIAGNSQGAKPQTDCSLTSQLRIIICMKEFLQDMQNFLWDTVTSIPRLSQIIRELHIWTTLHCWSQPPYNRIVIIYWAQTTIFTDITMLSR